MSSSEFAITVNDVSKSFNVYEQPEDRLKQPIYTRIQRLFRLPVKSYFREFRALHNISLSVRKGETIGIVGRNGSGKSTLLQIICGTLNQSSGSVVTNGRIAALLELGSGFNPEFSGRENVYLNGSLLGLSKTEIDEKYPSILAFADIGDFIDQPIKTYSSGMVVRLAFAVAINVEPDILVVDEALSVGDELFQRKCFSKIESIRASGATILFVSHSASSVVELCDKAILIDSGELLMEGSPKDVINHYQKLLYASEDEKKSIIEDIKNYERQQVSELALEDAEIDLSDTLLETFDPGLVPHSPFEYVPRGANIHSFYITTLDGRPVNGLIASRKYRYGYKVSFSENGYHVRFGMLIKSTSGLELGGGISTPTRAQSIPVVEAGTTLSVEFTFDCFLNPNIYFLNAGVLGSLDDEDTFLHRKIDAVAFRVLPQQVSTSTEFIDFNCCFSVTIDG
jgi:lipopolysaccharide transport system ATP-binding protein